MQKWSSTGAFRLASKQLSEYYNSPITYRGTIKLHGTNAGISYYDGKITTQSRSNELSYKDDNFGFHRWVMDDVMSNPIFYEEFVNICSSFMINPTDIITIYGEYCGPGIQRNVAISQLPNKQWFIFGVKRNGETLLLPGSLHISHPQIHNILDFPTYILTIDPYHKSDAVEFITNLTLLVEEECPVAKTFGLNGVGEGLVWTAVDYPSDSQLSFKSKGEKHTSKDKTTKVIASVDPVKLKLIEDLIDYILPLGRLQQGLEHVDFSDMKNMSIYLKWICNDIIQEETDTLSTNNLLWKDVAKLTTDKARQFYIKSFNAIDE